MPKIKMTIEDLEVGQSVTVSVAGMEWIFVDEPDPGEEAPVEEEKPALIAVSKVVGE